MAVTVLEHIFFLVTDLVLLLLRYTGNAHKNYRSLMQYMPEMESNTCITHLGGIAHKTLSFCNYPV